MIIYILIIIILYTCRFKNKVYTTAALLLFLVAALRSVRIGTDTCGYVDAFNGYRDITAFREVLFYYFLEWIKSTGIGEQEFLAFMAALMFTPLFMLIKKKSVYPVFSLLIFFVLTGDSGYSFFLSGMRQSMAMAFIFLSYIIYESKFPYGEKKEFIIKSVLIMVCALISVNIHTSTLFAYLLLLAAHFIKISDNLLIKVIVVLTFIGIIFNINNIGLVNNVLSLFSSDNVANMVVIYSDYVDERGIVARAVTALPISFTALMSIKYGFSKERLSHLYYYGTILTLILNSFPTINRVFLPITLLQVIILPNVYQIANEKDKKLIMYAVVLMIMLFIYEMIKQYMLFEHTNRRINIIPYEFFFE